MGENELDIKTGAMYYSDAQGEVYKLLMPISELPYVENAEPHLTTPGNLEGTMTIHAASELYWIIVHGYEKLRLYNYLDIRCGTDRRRIKRHKRRIRMFKIKQKIAESRGQIQK